MNIYNYIFNFINIMSIQHLLQQYTHVIHCQYLYDWSEVTMAK